MEESHSAIVAKEKSHRKKVVIAICALVAFILCLAGFSWWAMSEKKKADEQTLRAEENAQRAEEQQHKAEDQERIAKIQQLLAEQANLVAEQ